MIKFFTYYFLLQWLLKASKCSINIFSVYSTISNYKILDVQK